MCGSAGMFVGCAAFAACPRSLAFAPSADGGAVDTAEAPAYRSPFSGWDTGATVRAAPRRVYSADDAAAPPISPELVPVAGHADVRALSPERFRTVLLQHLYRYLQFTVALETMVVNRTVLGIANGAVGVALPDRMREDAYRIYCDEGYHALFSADLMRQIENVTGQPAVLPARPYFLTRLDALLADVEPERRALVELLFVVVSETLISATLAENAGRTEMARSVRDAIRDHALDEGRHHAYFATFVRHLWPQLSPAERRFAGALVPTLVALFLDPDVDSVRADLLGCGMPREQVDGVVAECFAPDRLREQRHEMARQTLQCFADLGAFAGNEPRERIFEHDLSAS